MTIDNDHHWPGGKETSKRIIDRHQDRNPKTNKDNKDNKDIVHHDIMGSSISQNAPKNVFLVFLNMANISGYPRGTFKAGSFEGEIRFFHAGPSASPPVFPWREHSASKVQVSTKYQQAMPTRGRNGSSTEKPREMEATCKAREDTELPISKQDRIRNGIGEVLLIDSEKWVIGR